ncbi:OmpP1/FadL family transporter [Cysteiniphilum halobium]|uniref:OmpP1/FadL family transporter n=1 Tax=Cysteiniphilum halobium TaxID=2219059 RepID=UPI003F847EA1
MRKIYKLSFLAVTFAVACRLEAAGFQVNENSAYLQGMAMAGSAASPDDVSSIFNNPANLGFVKDSSVYISGSYILPSVTMTGAQASHGVHYSTIPFADDPVSGASSQNSVVEGALVPNLYGAWRINDRLAAGVSLTVPWGMTTNYDDNSVVRYAAQTTSIEVVNLTPEIAFNIIPEISIAAGLQIQYASAEFSNYDGELAAPTDQATDIRGNGWGVGGIFGVMFHPTKATYLGLSYRTSVKMNIDGSGNQYLVPGGITPPIPGFPYNSHISDASTSFRTPGVINFGLTQDITQKWQVRGTVQYTMWSTLDRLTIDMPGAYATSSSIHLGWKNSWLFSLGTDYKITPHWSVRTGVAYDQTPTVSETRDARMPDSNRIWVTLGGTYHVNNHFSIDAVYEHIFMLNQSINVTEYSGSNTNVPNIEQNKVSADYRGFADIIGLALRYKF